MNIEITESAMRVVKFKELVWDWKELFYNHMRQKRNESLLESGE